MGEREDEKGGIAVSRQEVLAELMERTIRYIRSRSHGKGAQGRALRMLKNHGSMTQQELQIRLDVQPSSVSEVLTKLESAGLITRVRDEADRRRCIITITPAGEEDLKQHEAARIRRQSVLYAGLSDDEQNELIRLLEILQKSWNDGEEETTKEGV